MKHIAKVFVALSVTSLLLIGPGATAASNINTTLKLKANKTHVQKGGKVTFTIKLKSKNDKCTDQQHVKFYRNGKYKKTYTTNNTGKVSFKKKIKSNGKFYAKYEGRKFGTHPNVKNCLGSKSNTIKITVK